MSPKKNKMSKFLKTEFLICTTLYTPSPTVAINSSVHVCIGLHMPMVWNPESES